MYAACPTNPERPRFGHWPRLYLCSCVHSHCVSIMVFSLSSYCPDVSCGFACPVVHNSQVSVSNTTLFPLSVYVFPLGRHLYNSHKPFSKHGPNPPPPSYQHSPNTRQPPASNSMFTPPTRASPSNFKPFFDKAFEAYRKKVKQDLTAIPLFSQLQACDSPAAILIILQGQVGQFIQSRSGDERLKRWISPTINVLYAFSAVLGEGVGSVDVNPSVGDIPLMPVRQVFSPAKVIFAGAGVLLLVSALVYLLVSALVTSGVHRRLRTSKIAKMSSSISLSSSTISFKDSKFTPMSHLLRL